ncbi:LysE family transporter [Acinetobacter faecalis]|uniref:LysE family transporter n=1 Tax=Acinetobacter faecalis TaxID=2665161 RepID=UPI002A90BE26|nr:LysE family transporter [Acinetobacter faecalis]MDY6458012.1 LysE family transporter [Acinetobacter faecalis]
MLWALFTLFFIHLCALVSPGPDFFIVSQTAVSRSRKQAIFVVLGITCAILLWALFALLGLNYILEKFVWLHKVLLVLGGLYLCWLGFQLLKSAFSKKDEASPLKEIELPQSNLRFFLQGLFTNLANPKAVIYFGSVFSMFLANPVLNESHTLLLAIVTLESFVWFMFVVFVFSLPSFKNAYQKSTRWIDGLVGGLFSLFGGYLIFTK